MLVYQRVPQLSSILHSWWPPFCPSGFEDFQPTSAGNGHEHSLERQKRPRAKIIQRCWVKAMNICWDTIGYNYIYIYYVYVYYHIHSYTIAYYHILSHTVIHYHLLSFTIIYFHILSYTIMYYLKNYPLVMTNLCELERSTSFFLNWENSLCKSACSITMLVIARGYHLWVEVTENCCGWTSQGTASVGRVFIMTF